MYVILKNQVGLTGYNFNNKIKNDTSDLGVKTRFNRSMIIFICECKERDMPCSEIKAVAYFSDNVTILKYNSPFHTSF